MAQIIVNSCNSSLANRLRIKYLRCIYFRKFDAHYALGVVMTADCKTMNVAPVIVLVAVANGCTWSAGLFSLMPLPSVATFVFFAVTLLSLVTMAMLRVLPQDDPEHGA